jgi:hypothetical protein
MHFVGPVPHGYHCRQLHHQGFDRRWRVGLALVFRCCKSHSSPGVFLHFLPPSSSSYLLALGAKRTAEVKRDARIGEVQAKMESGIKVRYVLTQDRPALHR